MLQVNLFYASLYPLFPAPTPFFAANLIYYLDLLWFSVTQTGVHLCQTLFTQYFLQLFVDGFQILRYGDYG